MIIKKLKAVSGCAFPGAAYNEKKVKEGVAELIGHANIDGNFLHTLHTLHNVGIDCGREVEQYLQSRSQTYGNTKSTRWQLHLALSCKGQEKSKEQLVDIAHAMMDEYGAGKQPYLIYFHHDTDNNHVHILSTRVDSRGRMLSDHNDYARLNNALNNVITNDMRNDLDRIFAYVFTTEGQLMNIARGFNYKVGASETDKNILVFFHGGAEAFAVSRNEVADRIAEVKNNRREKERMELAAKQMKAIFIKYREKSLEQTLPLKANKNVKTGNSVERAKNKKDLMKNKSANINPDIKKLKDADGNTLSKTEQYQLNWLIKTLRSKFGVAIHFQKDKNGVIRGYDIVDHNNKVALNGSEVMKLADIVNFKEWQAKQETNSVKTSKTEKSTTQEVKHSGIPIFDWKSRSRMPNTDKSKINMGPPTSSYARLQADSESPRIVKQQQHSQQPQQPVQQPRLQGRPDQQAQVQQPKNKPKASIYKADSILDIYRPLFNTKVGKINGKKCIRIELGGQTYDHEITDNQSRWYALAPAEARGDIAIRLAVFYFYEKIYDSYRRQLADLYVKSGCDSMSMDGNNIRCMPLPDNKYRLCFDYEGGSIQYKLNDEESRQIRGASYNKSELRSVKAQLFKKHVVREDVNAITRNLKYEDFKTYPSYAMENDTAKNVIDFANRHQQLMQNLVNVLSVKIGNSDNREFEVGGHRANWNDIDDDRRYRGGLSM